MLTGSSWPTCDKNGQLPEKGAGRLRLRHMLISRLSDDARHSLRIALGADHKQRRDGAIAHLVKLARYLRTRVCVDQVRVALWQRPTPFDRDIDEWQPKAALTRRS